MKVKFNKFERVAGLFVMSAILGTLLSGVVVAVKKGWFERKVELKTKFETAAGLNPGTQVQMSGLKVGHVETVELVSDNEVIVVFTVPQKHLAKIKQDSHVRTIRPFLIGDKVLEVTVGSPTGAPVDPQVFLTSEPSMDIMDVLGGRMLTEYLQEMGSMMGSLKTLLKAFSDENRAKNVIAIFDQMYPLLVNVNHMAQEMTGLSRQMTRKKNLQKVVENLVGATDLINVVVPQISEAMKASPHLAKDMIVMLDNMTKLMSEMTKVIPAITEVAPDLPRASKRAIEAMDEAVVTLKAMQKSFLLSGKVEEVREEEAKAKAAAVEAEKQKLLQEKTIEEIEESERQPANE